MQVKKFEAPTMQEALKVIKRELGPEAIILSTKHIKSGFGLMSKASVEVTAAIAEKDLKKKNAAEKNLPQNVKEKIWNSKASKQAEIYDDYFEKQLKRAGKDTVDLKSKRTTNATSDDQAGQKQQQQQRERQRQVLESQMEARQQRAQQATQAMQSTIARAAAQPRAQVAAPAAPTASLRERRYIDIGEDDHAPAAPVARAASDAPPASPDRMRGMQAEIEQLKSMVVELASGASQQETARDEAEHELSPELVNMMHDLISSGIEKKFARQMVRSAAFDLNPSQTGDAGLIQEKIAQQFLDEIKVADLLEGVGASNGRSSCSIISLVGPTGVGKTTTIAKIASLGILEKRLRVGLINLDSYKVAAADQLSTYAKIMNVPFRSVNTKEELNQAIFDFSSLDLVLIDTTGRSQKDQESLLQLRHMLANMENSRNVLMISATTKDSDIQEVISRFKIFNPAGLVFSKLDETSVFGCIVNAQKRCGLPLLYFTVGQRVPEDIEKASAERVVDLILDL